MTVENPRVKFFNKKLIVDSHSPFEIILTDHKNEFDNVLVYKKGKQNIMASD
jgi:hypothetical protein